MSNNVETIPTIASSIQAKIATARSTHAAAKAAAQAAYGYLTDLDAQTKKERTRITKKCVLALESGDDTLLAKIIEDAERAGIKF